MSELTEDTLILSSVCCGENPKTQNPDEISLQWDTLLDRWEPLIVYSSWVSQIAD